MESSYITLAEHYENCYKKFGDNHKGVDWPDENDVIRRYEIMLEIIKDFETVNSLLDFGCGLSHLYEFMRSNEKYLKIKYAGLDISKIFIEVSKAKYNEIEYFHVDLLKEEFDRKFDYIIMNGVFTEKRGLKFEDMLLFWQAMILKAYKIAKKGVAFNVMSKHVDWEREDLFHLPFDLMASFICKNLTRDFIIRNDYGLYEYTVYIFRKNE